MGRQIIELVQVLVDRIEKNGYQQRAREENAFDLNKRLTEAEGWAAHWKQARQEAHEAGELMKAEIETLRKELANAKRAASDEFTERQVLTVEQQQDAAAWQQQVDSANAEVSYLRARLDEERSVIAGLRQQLRTAAGRVDLTEENNRSLRQQLDAANAAVSLQRAGIERLQAFVAKARQTIGRTMNYCDVEFLLAALAELDTNSSVTLTSSPTPVTEPLDTEGGA